MDERPVKAQEHARQLVGVEVDSKDGICPRPPRSAEPSADVFESGVRFKTPVLGLRAFGDRLPEFMHRNSVGFCARVRVQARKKLKLRDTRAASAT